MRSPDFNFERINGASKACGPLYSWAVSQVAYATILERVAPLRAELRDLAANRESMAERVRAAASPCALCLL